MNYEKINIVRSAYIETLNGCKDTEQVCSDNWVQTITPSKSERWFNRVIFSRFSAENIQSEVGGKLEIYQKNKSDCEWLVWPDTEPMGLSDFLSNQGFTREESSEGLLNRTQNYKQFDVPDGLSVEEISFEDIERYVEVMVAGWDSRTIDAEFARSRIETLSGKNDFFWVKKNGVPIATGETQYVSLSGYLSGSCVHPQYRGLGAYRLLVRARLQKMYGKGVEFASAIALSNSSAPVLLRLGFENIGPIQYFARPYSHDKCTEIEFETTT